MLEMKAREAKAHHDKATQYADRAEQHAVSCGLTIISAYKEIEEQRASLPEGEKKTIMGKGDWLKLAGISSQSASNYRAIAEGTKTLKELRATNATANVKHRAHGNLPSRDGEKPVTPKQHHLFHQPDPKGTAGVISLFVECFQDDEPHEVLPHLKGLVSTDELTAAVRYLKKLIKLTHKDESR